MILLMLRDLAIFFCIFSVFWGGFATAFLALFHPRHSIPSGGDGGGEQSGGGVSGFRSMGEALLTLLHMMLGDGDYGLFEVKGGEEAQMGNLGRALSRFSPR
jgi:hypothetical protein